MGEFLADQVRPRGGGEARDIVRQAAGVADRETVAAVRADPALAPRLIAAGYSPLPPRPVAEDEAFIAVQISAWGTLVTRSGARVD